MMNLPSVRGEQYGENNPRWKGDDIVNADVLARRYFKIPEGTLCYCGCGEPAEERHHLDGNNRNNLAENVVFIKHSCHMKLHWKDPKWRANQVAKRKGVSRATPATN